MNARMVVNPQRAKRGTAHLLYHPEANKMVRSPALLAAAMTLAILVALVASVGASAPSPAAPAFRVLVVAANDRYHGAMSDAAEPLLESLGAENGFAVDFTHDATVLRDEELARHAVVVQLHLAPFDMTNTTSPGRACDLTWATMSEISGM